MDRPQEIPANRQHRATQDKTELWREVCYLIFDAPSAGGAFEDRLAFINDAVAGRGLKYARPHKHERCRNVDSLRAEWRALKRSAAKAHAPPARLEIRSRALGTLLKVKNFTMPKPR